MDDSPSSPPDSGRDRDSNGPPADEGASPLIVARTIGPALKEGHWVISDRFSDSTYAYQGAGRGVERETIRRIDSAVLDDFAPDLTLILDLDVETGLARAKARLELGLLHVRLDAFTNDLE